MSKLLGVGVLALCVACTAVGIPPEGGFPDAGQCVPCKDNHIRGGVLAGYEVGTEAPYTLQARSEAARDDVKQDVVAARTD